MNRNKFENDWNLIIEIFWNKGMGSISRFFMD